MKKNNVRAFKLLGVVISVLFCVNVNGCKSMPGSISEDEKKQMVELGEKILNMNFTDCSLSEKNNPGGDGMAAGVRKEAEDYSYVMKNAKTIHREYNYILYVFRTDSNGRVYGFIYSPSENLAFTKVEVYEHYSKHLYWFQGFI